ncbi:hypothetical protein SRABI106_04738 [Rahnella aquatilis]|nr:hypothetical protein SRABI106_04738 [Rahnella aquatilis]
MKRVEILMLAGAPHQAAEGPERGSRDIRRAPPELHHAGTVRGRNQFEYLIPLGNIHRTLCRAANRRKRCLQACIFDKVA